MPAIHRHRPSIRVLSKFTISCALAWNGVPCCADAAEAWTLDANAQNSAAPAPQPSAPQPSAPKTAVQQQLEKLYDRDHRPLPEYMQRNAAIGGDAAAAPALSTAPNGSYPATTSNLQLRQAQPVGRATMSSSPGPQRSIAEQLTQYYGSHQARVDAEHPSQAPQPVKQAVTTTAPPAKPRLLDRLFRRSAPKPNAAPATATAGTANNPGGQITGTQTAAQAQAVANAHAQANARALANAQARAQAQAQAVAEANAQAQARAQAHAQAMAQLNAEAQARALAHAQAEAQMQAQAQAWAQAHPQAYQPAQAWPQAQVVEQSAPTPASTYRLQQPPQADLRWTPAPPPMAASEPRIAVGIAAPSPSWPSSNRPAPNYVRERPVPTTITVELGASQTAPGRLIEPPLAPLSPAKQVPVAMKPVEIKTAEMKIAQKPVAPAPEPRIEAAVPIPAMPATVETPNPFQEQSEAEADKSTSAYSDLILDLESPQRAATSTAKKSSASGQTVQAASATESKVVPEQPDAAEAPALAEPEKPDTRGEKAAAPPASPAAPHIAAPPIAPAHPTTVHAISQHPAAESAVPRAFTEPQHATRVSQPQDTAIKMRKIAERGGMTGLKGFCPVALRDDRDLQDAKVAYASTFESHTYCFSSAESKARFDQRPARYAPVAGGMDIVVKLNSEQTVEGSLDYAVWYKDRLYLFSSPESQEAFSLNPRAYAGSYARSAN